MKPEPNHKLDKYRVQFPGHPQSPNGANYGYFQMGSLRIISSGSANDGDSKGINEVVDKWEHVSVSVRNRCPTWSEMCIVKDLFWGQEETVLQFHPKKSAYVNLHPFVLHLWKRVVEDYELPPKETMV